LQFRTDFGNISVPDPSSQYLAQFFHNQKNCSKSCLFSVKSSIISKKVGLSFLIFYFYVGSGSKSGSGIGTVLHSGSGAIKAKSYGSCGSGSGSTTLFQNPFSEKSDCILVPFPWPAFHKVAI
jgi:hypothetical protein